MTKLTNAMIASVLLSTAIWTVSAFAADPGSASAGNGESMRDVTSGDFKPGRAKPIAPPKLTDEDSRAAPLADEATAVKSYGIVGRSADGKEIKIEPSEALRELIIKQLNAPADGADGAQRETDDPDLGEGEAGRQVFGPDDRVQVKNTKTYPFSAIGYLEAKSKTGFGSCSATLIGPRTVLTAAHCLYSHEDKDWLADYLFVPGLNGSTADDAPFGAFAYESAYVLQGFIDNYQGYYGSVIPWDLGIVTLKQDVGTNLGWLGYANYDDLGDFTANLVGYPGDKPMGTMWKASCEVHAENIGPEYFQYDCDTFPGSSGSSVYAYDNNSKQRIITGVNVAESPDANTAVRLNAANIQWINSLYK
ncbi:peptidase [Mesorhizobium sp. LNHC221B00]|uniref:trypsin-like serine peptidase n=1 Tax=Mesorhizobium sp. LNHC221B00 TaxID=1287233 RepID=UPI0003CEA8C1|nr:serine protease [Mesorhizobium sp. LNHC221B00]ESY77745.1 peptidase [Mesorhizobium sp. LNHC221B00]